MPSVPKYKPTDAGFTLIEMLVTVIILSILAAIALPSFLNQANKARQSEAKTYIGSINRAQQAYFTEYGRFGESTELEGGIPVETQNYSYQVSPDELEAIATASALKQGLKSYSAMVTAQGKAIVCETDAPQLTPILPNSTTDCGDGVTPISF